MKPFLSVQYLRALAALAVVAFHSERATPLGQAGVDVFFVISGFIMWLVTAKPIGPGEFLWHRVVRVVPLYWIATSIMAAHQRAEPWDIVRSLLFWPYRGTHGEVWPILVQGWTLNFEMFFYLLFALALFLPPRARLMALTAVLCGLGAIGLVFQPRDPIVLTYTSPLLLEFLAGIWISAAIQRGIVPGYRFALAMLAAGTIGFILSVGDYTPTLWRFLVWGIPATLVVGGAVSLECQRGVPAVRPLKLLGDCSYSIYLFHPFVLKTVARPLSHFPSVVAIAAVTAAGAAIGLVAYRLLERPITVRLGRRPPFAFAGRATLPAYSPRSGALTIERPREP